MNRTDIDALAIIHIAARLVRAIVVGPIARLERLSTDASATGGGDIIEAQIAAQAFAALERKEGEPLLLEPAASEIGKIMYMMVMYKNDRFEPNCWVQLG